MQALGRLIGVRSRIRPDELPHARNEIPVKEMTMHEECLICSAPLVYLQRHQTMTCVICQAAVQSQTQCERGHFVCDACHTSGIDAIFTHCLHAVSKAPIEILEELMALPMCHMHGPEHHILVGAALLTAYHNAGGAIDLPAALSEMVARGRQVPGGVCGFWGACGAGISTGIYLSIVTQATPLATTAWGQANQMTARALGRIGHIGGPRCCKRNAYLAILEAIAFTEDVLGVTLERKIPHCTRSAFNNQCLQTRCPFYSAASNAPRETPQNR